MYKMMADEPHAKNTQLLSVRSKYVYDTKY